jgi:hypothetical protein
MRGATYNPEGGAKGVQLIFEIISKIRCIVISNYRLMVLVN